MRPLVPQRFAYHYAMARCVEAGVRAFADLRDLAVSRIVAESRADRRIGADELDTALAVCALRTWAPDHPVAEHGAAFLRRTQRPDGSWPAAILFWGGRGRLDGWGSEEVTTALCLEALLR